MSCLPALRGAGKQLHRSSPAPVGPSPNPALDSLREELGEAAVTRFVSRYLSLLDQRILSIGSSIRERRIEPAITLLLTLETSSHMVGAADLSRRATALRFALCNQPADTAVLFEQLVLAGGSARQLLALS
jgi:hypothetical protein